MSNEWADSPDQGGGAPPPAAGGEYSPEPSYGQGDQSTPVAPADAGIVEAAASEIANLPGGHDIITEWGGSGSTDFAQNLGYMRHAVEHISRSDPGLLAMFNDEVEDEYGNVSRLGDNPALIRAAAEYGRLLAHKLGTDVQPVANASRSGRGRGAPAGRGGSPSPSRPTNADQDRLHDLIEKQLNAAARGDNITVARIERERQALGRRLWGSGPVVGQGGRNV